MSNIFGTIDTIDNKVQTGEISGVVSWPLEGECEVVGIDTDFKKGNPYLALKLRHPEKGNQTFLVRIPQESDKDNAKFMGMQRLYSTMYSVAGATPGKVSPSQAFEMAKAELAEGPLLAKYTLTEYESFNQTTGKTFTNQSLETLAIVEDAGEFA